MILFSLYVKNIPYMSELIHVVDAVVYDLTFTHGAKALGPQQSGVLFIDRL